MRNSPAWIAAYMAAIKAGGIATLINGWWQAEEMRHALALTEPTLIIADEARARLLAAAGCTIPIAALPVERPLAEALAPLLAPGTEADLPEIAPEDDATLLFTSGSTGLAKGAVSTHRAVTTAVYSYAIGLATLLGIKEKNGEASAAQPKTLVNVPLFHVTGEVPVLLNSFVIGRTMVLMPKWDAGEALRLIEKEKITYFVGVPTMSLELMQHPDRDKYDLSSLTDIAAGGAARPVAHVERLEQAFKGAQPALGYGLTETNAIGCSNFWSNYHDKPASTGRAHKPIVELAILGDGDRHLPPGERGEIGIRSAANFRAYWHDEAATRAAFTADLYLKTGDVGYLDEDGYLFIVDRKKDIIIRGGENISVQEVEAAIYSHPGVSEASVFGVPDERLGEVPAAIIYSEDKTVEKAELLDFLARHIARFKLPEHVWIADAPLPKLGTGKIDRVSLRQKYSQDLAA
jgi:acyl-CoA synthetase (AMP-forming)/AMP-acid ligase II